MLEFWPDNDLYENSHTLADIYNSIKNQDPFPFIKNVYTLLPGESPVFFGWWIAPYHLVKDSSECPLLETFMLEFFLHDNVICFRPDYPLSYVETPTYLEPVVCISDMIEHKKYALDHRAEHWLYKSGYNGIPLHVTVSCDCGYNDCPLEGLYYYNEGEDSSEWYLKPLGERSPLTRVHIQVYMDTCYLNTDIDTNM